MDPTSNSQFHEFRSFNPKGGGGGIKVSHLPNALLTLAPPSDYDLNLEALIKVSKVSSTSQLSYEILKSSFERKFR